MCKEADYIHDGTANQTDIDKPNASKTVTDTQKGTMTNLSEVRSMCPGAVEFYKNKTDPTLYPVKMAGCKSVPHLNDIRLKHRWQYGQCEDSFSFYLVLIQVPSGMNVRARMELLVPRRAFGRVRKGRWSITSFEKKAE